MTALWAWIALAALAADANPALPTTAILVPDQSQVVAELALTPAEQETGLMYRTELADGKGMLFVFPEEGPLNFWMKNTWIDLDMVFIGKDKKVTRVYPKVPRS